MSIKVLRANRKKQITLEERIPDPVGAHFLRREVEDGRSHHQPGFAALTDKQAMIVKLHGKQTHGVYYTHHEKRKASDIEGYEENDAHKLAENLFDLTNHFSNVVVSLPTSTPNLLTRQRDKGVLRIIIQPKDNKTDTDSRFNAYKECVAEILGDFLQAQQRKPDGAKPE